MTEADYMAGCSQRSKFTSGQEKGKLRLLSEIEKIDERANFEAKEIARLVTIFDNHMNLIPHFVSRKSLVITFTS